MTKVGVDVVSLGSTDHFGFKFVKFGGKIRMANMLCSQAVLHIVSILLANVFSEPCIAGVEFIWNSLYFAKIHLFCINLYFLWLYFMSSYSFTTF